MKQQTIKESQLLFNKGQIEGLPANPRIIKDAAYEQLRKSIADLPAMMELRELIVIQQRSEKKQRPGQQKYIVIAGNQRLAACRDEGWKQIPCKVLDIDTPALILREIAIKDNNHAGEDDWLMLTEQWEQSELAEWGFDISLLQSKEIEAETEEESGRMKHQKQIRLSYPENEYHEIKNRLSEIAETPELAVKIMLSKYTSSESK